MRVPALVLVGLLLSLTLPPAEAQEAREMLWEYRISIPDPASGRIDVEMRFHNLDGVVTELSLLYGDHEGYVGNSLRGGPSTELDDIGGARRMRVDDAVETVFVQFDVRRDAFGREKEALQHLDTDFALFKAESFALAFTYQYYEGRPFEWRGRVVFDQLPDGWRVATPWNRTAGDAYALAPGQVLPRGFLALGPFEEPLEVQAGAKTVRYVRLGEPAAYEDALVDYIEKATPYYEAAYGRGTGPNLLVVNAPDPMFRGGLGATDSFYVHETADLRTLAHEYAHVFQQFGTTEDAGRSAIWLAEGDADLHSALSLFATGHWTPDDVNDHFRRAERARDDLALSEARLPDATYGNSLERFAYSKGMTVLRALDALLRQETDGQITAHHLVRHLNVAHGHGVHATPAPVSNTDIREAASALAGRDLSDFFNTFVLGTAWPEVRPFVPEGDLVVSDLQLDPPSASPGEPVTATLRVYNSGTSHITDTVRLQVNGEERDAATVRLGVGEMETIALRFVAPDTGDHEVRVAYLRETFRSHAPPDLRLDRISFVPATVYAKEDVTMLAFVQNAGERAGTGNVEVLVDGTRVTTTPTLIVDGGASEAVSTPLRFDAPGRVEVWVRVLVDGETSDERLLTLTVRPADVDRDGIADNEDAYPYNPRLAEAGVVNDARDAVPSAPLALVLLVLVGLAVARRR